MLTDIKQSDFNQLREINKQYSTKEITREQYIQKKYDWQKGAGVETIIDIKNEIDEDTGLVIAEDWTLIQRGYCRKCKQKIKHWPGVFVGRTFYCSWIETHYRESSGYCLDCARQKAETDTQNRPYSPPVEVDVVRGPHGKETHKYDNGLEVEDLTPYDDDYWFYTKGRD